jgi:cellulose synthase (UDP-forming)
MVPERPPWYVYPPVSVLRSGGHRTQRFASPITRRLTLVEAGAERLAATASGEAAPYLLPLMSARQSWTFRCLLGVWLVALGFFWQWWLQADHVISLAGLVLNSELLVWTTAVPAWCFFFAHRARRPNRAVPVPAGRVAMVVTKTPKEPWFVVRRTLEAMLDQRLAPSVEFWMAVGRGSLEPPRTVSVWLADENPSEETRAWCMRHGVRISCRRSAAAYHQAVWPARTGCKEGNLRYFYEVMGGYDDYDFVVQLDADHVPDRDYLIEMLRPFADPRVGYVAAPSIGDANSHRSWTARARANAEALLHGVWQAGYNGGYPPLCFGSHYAVRTRALREVGGLGPELAEDHSTTLLLNAAGWSGAFAINAIAHGDGPTSLADALTQEVQWSRSVTILLLTWLPRTWRTLDVRGRLVFCATELWYPLFALHMLASYLLPTLALATRSPLVAVDLVDFMFHACLLGACSLAPVLWLRRQGWLRPVDARVLSWETGLYQLVRWPWVLLGVVQAVLSRVLRREFTWLVTPKGVDRARALPLVVLLPPIVLGLGQVAVALLVDAPGLALGYYAFVLVNAGLYILLSAGLIVLHIHETHWFSGGRLLAVFATVLEAVPVLAVACVALAAAVGMRGQTALLPLQPSITIATGLARGLTDQQQGDLPTRAQTALGLAGMRVTALGPVDLRSLWPGSMPPSRGAPLTLDLPSNRLAIGAYDPGQDLQQERLDIEHWFISQDEPERLAAALEHARGRRTLLVTIEPYPEHGRGPVLEATIDGEADAQVRQLARLIRGASPQVVLVRWGHEMDMSGLYPWASNQPALYRAAFRHVAGIFRAEGALNARFVWSPAGEVGVERFFPGDDVVDYVGLTILGDQRWDLGAGLPSQSFQDLLGPRYERVAVFGKQIIVAELGVSGSAEHQAAWLADISHSVSRFPALRALVYFNDRNPPVEHLDVLPDWRVRPELLRSLVAGVSPGSGAASLDAALATRQSAPMVHG